MINVEEYLDLVSFTINKYFIVIDKFDYEEKFQVGCMGLIKATEKYDESLGYKFSSYAAQFIRNYIKDYLTTDKWRMGSKKERLNKVAKIPLSLDMPIANIDGASTLLDIIKSKETEINEFESYIEIKDILNKSLNEKEKQVVILNVLSGYPQSKVANIMGYSSTHISRIKNKALNKLKNELTV